MEEDEIQNVRSLGKKESYSVPVGYIHVQGGRLELAVEPVELTGDRSGEKQYQVYVSVGDSANLIALPALNEQERLEIAQRVKVREYDFEVVKGIVDLKLDE